MKLLYATSITYPSPFANRYQMIAMARSFAAVLGDTFVFAGASLRNIKQVSLRTIRKRPSPFLALRYLMLIRKEGFTHVFMREERLLGFLLLYIWLLRTPVRCFLECHTVPRHDLLAGFAIRHADGIIAITKALADDLSTAYGISQSRIIVAHDAVDVALFANLPDKRQAREQLQLPHDRKIIAYTGSFGFRYPWKGVDTLLASVEYADRDWLYYLVGGTAEEIGVLGATHTDPRIVLNRHRSQEELPLVLAAADVVVIPNKKGDVHSERHTSPLKLFEYLASGTPVVASDLTSIREVVDESAVTFFSPNDPVSLASAIRGVFADPEGARVRANAAQAQVESRTWDARAEAILAFMDR